MIAIVAGVVAGAVGAQTGGTPSIGQLTTSYLDQDTLIESKLKLGAVARPQSDYIRPLQAGGANLSNRTVRGILRHTPAALFRHASLLTRLYFA